MPLVGRDAELARFREAAGGLAAGAPRSFVLLGEAGIGKSALLPSCGEIAPRPALLVLEGRAAEHERDVPFGLVVDALDERVARCTRAGSRRPGAELAAVLPAAGGSRRARPTAGAGRALPLPPGAAGAARAARARAAARAAARRPALGRRGVARAGAAPAAPAAAPPRLLLLRAAAGRAGGACCSTPRARPAAGRAAARRRSADEAALRAVAERARRRGCASGSRARRRGNPLFLRELAARSAPTASAAADAAGRGRPRGRRAAAGGAHAARGRRGRRRPVRPRARRRRRRARAGDALAALDRLVAAGLVRPAGDAPRRSRSATRWSAARSTTPRRPAGGSPRTSGRGGAGARAAPAAAARAYHVERYARPGDADGGRRCWPRPRPAPPTPPRRPRRTGTRAALELLPHATRRRGAAAGADGAALAGAGRLEESRAALDEALELLPARCRVVARVRARRAPARPPPRGAGAAGGRGRGRAAGHPRADRARARAGRAVPLRHGRGRRLGAPRAGRRGRRTTRRCASAPRRSRRSGAVDGRAGERTAALERAVAGFRRLTDRSRRARRRRLVVGIVEGCGERVAGCSTRCRAGSRIARETRQDALLGTLTDARGMLAVNSRLRPGAGRRRGRRGDRPAHGRGLPAAARAMGARR